MRWLVSILLTLAWGLWMGGLAAVFVVIMALAREFSGDHELFGRAGSALFRAFERYELFLAAATMTVAFIWFASGKSPAKIAVFVLMAMATFGAVCEVAYISPHIQSLRLASRAYTPEFQSFHKMAMYVYTAQTLLIAAAGAFLPAGFRADARPPAP